MADKNATPPRMAYERELLCLETERVTVQK
jgi:hypothetical protein